MFLLFTPCSLLSLFLTFYWLELVVLSTLLTRLFINERPFGQWGDADALWREGKINCDVRIKIVAREWERELTIRVLYLVVAVVTLPVSLITNADGPWLSLWSTKLHEVSLLLSSLFLDALFLFLLMKWPHSPLINSYYSFLLAFFNLTFPVCWRRHRHTRKLFICTCVKWHVFPNVN